MVEPPPPPIPQSACEENGHVCIPVEVGACTDGSTPFDDPCVLPDDPEPKRALCCSKVNPTECEMQGAGCLPMADGCPGGSVDLGMLCVAGGRPKDLECCSPMNPCASANGICVGEPDFTCPPG